MTIGHETARRLIAPGSHIRSTAIGTPPFGLFARMKGWVENSRYPSMSIESGIRSITDARYCSTSVCVAETSLSRYFAVSRMASASSYSIASHAPLDTDSTVMFTTL